MAEEMGEGWVQGAGQAGLGMGGVLGLLPVTLTGSAALGREGVKM